MKQKIKILLFFGVVFFMAFSCKKVETDGYEDIPIEYAKCNCNQEEEFIKEISYENILLFDSAKTIDVKEFFKDKNTFSFILFSPKSQKVEILSYAYNNDILYNDGIGFICNFPIEIFTSTNIPKDGLIVNIEAEVYKSCNAKSSTGMGVYCSDYILTALKIKKR